MSLISFDNINSWQDFKSYAESLPNKKKTGDAFEHLTYLYFKLEPKYSFYDEVYKMSDVPTSDLEKLNIPRQDLGIDLIAKVGNEYHPIQCKYHTEKKRSITFSEVSTFLTQLESNNNFKMGYIASTADNTSKNYDKLNTKEVQKLLNNTWYKLDESFFNRVREFEKGKEYSPEPFFPREHQETAVENAYKHFIKENNSRGKLIFPCGAGKSLTGYWMMEKLASKSTIVAVPSLSLIKQTLDVYLKEVVARNKSVKWLCICSDEGIGKNDDVLYKTNEVGVPCTTEVEYIKSWLKRNQKEEIIIFTTYQSGRIIADISKSLGFTFDLGIYDEAHKTVGKNESLFSYLLFEKNISIKNRIFMTATERFYRGVKDDVLTMDDPEDYGEVFSHMSFKEAIERELLTDYKVITIEVKKEEVAEFIKENNLVKLNAKWGKESEARSLASMIALRKAMKTFPIKNAVSFHSSIDRAVRSKEVQSYISETYNYQPIETFTVSGKLPTSKREVVVNEFASSNKALITNSRCLTEGVDVPNIDCIVFADPRKSKVDIVQALGRALRKKKGKEWGYVILPIIYDHSTQEIDNDNFQEILNIVRGLAANDERIIEEFKDKSQNSSRVTGSREEIFSIDPVLLEESELVGNLNIKLWEKLSRFNWMPFEEARSYIRKLNLKSSSEYIDLWRSGKLPKTIPGNPRGVYKTSGFVSMPDFLGYDSLFQDWLDWEGHIRIIHKLKLKSAKEYRKYIKENKIPGIHSSPESYFKKLWEDNGGWSGFLGKNLSPQEKSKIRVPYQKAKKFVWDLKLKTGEEWKKYTKSKDFPDFLPKNPGGVYKEWKGIKDWVGPTYLERNQRAHLKYYSFEECKKIVFDKKFDSIGKFKSWAERPDKIPYHPDSIYKSEWQGWSDFLGSKPYFNKDKNYLNWSDSSKILQNLGIKSSQQFRDLKNSSFFPKNIPPNPPGEYRDIWNLNGGWGGYLNTGNSIHYTYIDFKALKKLIFHMNFKSKTDYSIWGKSINWKYDNFNIPSSPMTVFKRTGEWKGWSDFLGKNTDLRINNKLLDRLKNYYTYKEARIIVSKMKFRNVKEYQKFSKSKKRPNKLPSNPYEIYKASGDWLGWNDFLGKEKT